MRGERIEKHRPELESRASELENGTVDGVARKANARVLPKGRTILEVSFFFFFLYL